MQVEAFAVGSHADAVISAGAAGPAVPFVLGGVKRKGVRAAAMRARLRVLVPAAGEFQAEPFGGGVDRDGARLFDELLDSV
ncbi:MULTISPECIES: hypothetical protein [unclassified Mesorhizobium]|uniref:hypothetical protein n=1 Tax=unclassified Mesorhizobium TaxID=325217 RepID=UPI00241573D2|nr:MULTISPECIES: hypothetical protein [unclassified Mesorhizobium]MDG4854572.1 hypothetical protein [Mesorhizobium sp. WSM4982]